MKTPKEQNLTLKQVLEKYKETVLYYLNSSCKSGKATVKPCMISPMTNKEDVLWVNFFDNDFKLNVEYSQYVSWDKLYVLKEEADNKAKHINELYSSFRYEPYVSVDILENHLDELYETEKLIDKLLSSFENYEGIDFCDVSAGGIQVRIHHKAIKGYSYGNQFTIKYDFSNIKEIPWQVARHFYEIDTPEQINDMKSFISFGERYGWD